MNNEGWICPVCRRGKAPHVETCDCTEAQSERRELVPLEYPDGTTKIAPPPFGGWVLPWSPQLPDIWPTYPQPPYRVTWYGLPSVMCGGHHIQ